MKSLFWADQIAKEIITRKKFHYLDKPVPKFREYTVKTSASISGVLHIGRLSDTIRGETVFRALKDMGCKAKFIWVAEDMDPLRKVPKGVPANYKQYIGMAVTDIPDPDGCHTSYAEHNKSEYFRVIDEFIDSKMKKFSMREEYRKGFFKKFIKKMIDNIDKVIEIQNKYRTEPLKEGWSPWTPICENCGKIITPRIITFENGIAYYKCEDYRFENTKAEGCGHKGENDPLKGNGKLLWKAEWASQWAHWNVVSEGAGKEYQVPMSAWWVNAELAERILEFPMPIPIFYEHLIIDGEKMSASKGNVIYPSQWLDVAEPQILRFFYNKRLMKTRSFSWKFLPQLYDDYDIHSEIFAGKKIVNKSDEEHMKRLFGISQRGPPQRPLGIPYSFAALISQMFDPAKGMERAIKVMQFTGHLGKKITAKKKKDVERRLKFARKWVMRYAPPETRITLNDKLPRHNFSKNNKRALLLLLQELRKDVNEKELQSNIYEIARSNNMQPKEFFKLMYQILINKDSGPRLGPFIIAIGKEKVISMLENLEK